MGEKLTIRSLNVNGIQCKHKRELMFHELTKYNDSIILLQETHSSIFDEKMYKNKWGPNVYFSHGTTQSKGVCTIIPKNFKGSSELVYADLEGRFLITQIRIYGKEYVICNIYAPVSSHEKEQVSLINKVSEELADIMNQNIIIGGDWNVYMDNFYDKKTKSKNPNVCPNHKYREHLKNFLDEMELSDCWRLANPNKRKFTCRSGKKGEGVTQTRIDMIFIKDNLLNILTDTKIEPGFKSDHNFVTVTLKVNDSKRGRGTWKFNNKLLKDRNYVDLIKNMIIKEINESNHYEDKGYLWDYMKMRIRSETMIYTSQLNKLKNDHLKKLNDEIKTLDEQYMDNPTDNVSQQLDTAKKELEDLNKEQVMASIFRSKCEWAEHGEKSSKFFLNLEKHNYENKHITAIEVNKDTILTDEKEVLDEIKNFYETLYSSNQIDHKKLDEVLKDIPKLNDRQKKQTKGLITYEECLKALKSLKNGKTPGLDGITTDFYKFFWIDISTTVLQSINYAFAKNEMSKEQRSGLISLSPKKNKLRKFLKNWRPITLLTVDYKLLAKALALRLRTILPDYIDESQFGYVKDRYIGENIRCVMDLNTFCAKENKEAYAIQIDFEKAFDSVNWEFMAICLEEMNFDKDFINWVKVLYKNTTSCVANNGHKTENFNLKRGVHQGCPLSALLFIILVQVLKHMLHQCKDISGILVGDKEIKILQMADDTTILTSNMKDIPKILKLLKVFYEISGLKTNVDKTVAYKLGRNKDFTHSTHYLGLTWSKPPINLLGISITENIDDLKKENFTNRIESMSLLTRIWSGRNLSMKGKLVVINSLLIPKLIYPCTILDVPTDTVKKVSNIIRDFFWNWKRPKIKVDVLVRKIENGGIKYPCLDCKIKSWKTLWAIRALKTEHLKPLWTRIVDKLLPTGISLTYLFKCKPNKKFLDTYCPDLPIFYKDIILNWSEINKDIKFKTKESIKQEPLWLNYNIIAGREPMYNPHAASHKILYIADVLNANEDFASNLELNTKYHTNLTFLDTLKIRLTIPHEWKQILLGKTEEIKTDELLHKKLHNYKKLKTNDIYWTLLEKNHECQKITTTQAYWQEKYNLDIDDFKYFLLLPYKSTRRTTLQALQYKIIYKIINCNYWLHKITIIDSPKCRFCTQQETVEHFFYGCKITKEFWYAFQTWWNINTCQNINIIYEYDVVLGYKRDKEENKVFNCCILIAKHMIYNNKNTNTQPDIYKFHCALKDFITIEKYIATNQNSLDSMKDDWGDLMEI